MTRFHSIADLRIRRRRRRLMFEYWGDLVYTHNWRKWVSLGGCGNRHCSLCACYAEEKRLRTRRRRYRGRRVCQEETQ